MKGRSIFFAAKSAALIRPASVVPGFFADRLTLPHSAMAATPRRRFSEGILASRPGDVEARGIIPFRVTAAAISTPCCW